MTKVSYDQAQWGRCGVSCVTSLKLVYRVYQGLQSFNVQSRFPTEDNMRGSVFFCVSFLLSCSYSKSFFSSAGEDKTAPVGGSSASVWSSWLVWPSQQADGSKEESHWDRYLQSVEDLWADLYNRVQSYDYSNLSGAIRQELTESLATVSQLGDNIRTSLLAGGETLSTQWREKYSQAADLLTHIKTNLQLSNLLDKKELNKKIDQFLSSWQEFSISELVQKSYRDLTKGPTSNITVKELLLSVKSSISDSGVSSYAMVEEYLRNLQTREPVCSMKVLTCPDGM